MCHVMKKESEKKSDRKSIRETPISSSRYRGSQEKIAEDSLFFLVLGKKLERNDFRVCAYLRRIFDHRSARAGDDATRSTWRVSDLTCPWSLYRIGFTRWLCRVADNPGIVGSLMSGRCRLAIIVVPFPLFIRHNDFKPVITLPCWPRCCLAEEELTWRILPIPRTHAAMRSFRRRVKDCRNCATQLLSRDRISCSALVPFFSRETLNRSLVLKIAIFSFFIRSLWNLRGNVPSFFSSKISLDTLDTLDTLDHNTIRVTQIIVFLIFQEKNNVII